MKNSILIAGILTLVFASSALAQQTERKKAKELLESAKKELQAGNREQAHAYMAEAWALTADAFWLEKNATASRDAWKSAEKYGWRGTPPWVKWSSEPVAPAPKPSPAPTRRAPPPQEETWQEEEEQPERETREGEGGDLWETYKTAPYRTGRNNVWTSLVNIPSLEDATPLPEKMWIGLIGIELVSADFSDTSGGGTTRWDATLVQEIFEADYGYSENIQLGVRLTTGELTENSSTPVTVYDNGNQIIPNGSRGLGVESLVFRGKITGEYDFADAGLLAELKLPIAGEEDLVTTDSMDLGISGLVSRELSDVLTGTVNLGFVLPIGDAGVFTNSSYDDLSLVIHGGGAISYTASPTIVLVFQLEGNTSPFGEVAALDQTPIGAYISGRYRMTDTSFLGVVVGTGFGDLGADLTLGLSGTFTF